MAATKSWLTVTLRRTRVRGGAEPRRWRNRRIAAGGIVAGVMLVLMTASSHAFVEEQKLVVADGVADDRFGSGVATDGERIAACRAGAAYVYAQNDGVWTEIAKLEPSDGASGYCRRVFFDPAPLAINGDVVVVGAGDAAVDGRDFDGKVYVYREDDEGTWTETQILTAPDGEGSSRFGDAVALDGERLVVGSPGVGPDGERPGTAYVFGGPQRFILFATLRPSDPQEDAASFGASVAIQGGLIVVGAPTAQVGDNRFQGAAYVYGQGTSLSNWTELKLTASDGANQAFGTAVAVAGGTVVVGADGADSLGSPNQGAAYVFTEAGGTLVEAQRLRAPDPAASDRFGYAVAIEGDTLIVGAPFAAIGEQDEQGAAYVFTRVDGTWMDAAKLVAADGAGGDRFANVAMAGHTLVIGATLADVDGSSDQGAAYVFHPDAIVPTTTIELDPAAPDGSNDWYVSPVHVTVSASDDAPGVGVAELRCVLDPAIVPASFTDLPAGCPFSDAGTEIEMEGTHTLYAASLDQAGNPSPVVGEMVLIDRTGPIVTCQGAPSLSLNQPGVVTAAVTDRASGPEAASIFALADTSSAGVQTVDLTAVDRAGNASRVSCPYVVLDSDDGGGSGNGNGGGDTCPSDEEAVYEQHFAEGATGVFQTNLGLFNPSRTETARVRVTLLPEAAGDTVSGCFTLEPFTRVTLDVNGALGERTTGVSTRVESDTPVAATRQMTWEASGFGSTLESGAPQPSTQWYFAEGATSIFDLFYLYSNPNDVEARVTTRYLRGDGAPVEEVVVIPPETRRTVHVNAIPGLASAEVAADISADMPIVAERAMYFRGFASGSVARGATTLATSWFFAEGSTAFFDTFALFGNPGPADATVSVRYQLADGTTLSNDYLVPAGRRRTVWLNGEVPGLGSGPVAMQITSTQPIVAERAMWWGPTSASWYESHASLGATETGTVWAVGDGAAGGPLAEDTYVLVANMSPRPGRVALTVVLDNGTQRTQTYELAPHARLSVPIAQDFAPDVAGGQRFSVLVESEEVDGTAVPLVVEVSRYQSVGGRFGAGGGATLASKIH